MIFSVSNDGFVWSLDFGPDSVTLTAKDLVHDMTIKSQENLLAAKNLLPQRQEFSINHLALVPVTLNQQGTHEMWDKVLSIVGAQDMHTSGYKVSDVEDVEFTGKMINGKWTLSSDRTLIPPFHQQLFLIWRWEVQQKTPCCSTKRKTRRTLLLQQQHQSPRDQPDPLHCCKNVLLEQKQKIFLILFIEFCFNKYYSVCVFMSFINNIFQFFKTCFNN